MQEGYWKDMVNYLLNKDSSHVETHHSRNMHIAFFFFFKDGDRSLHSRKQNDDNLAIYSLCHVACTDKELKKNVQSAQMH